MPTAIEWTEETWNPITGCTRVSPGCAHCYIERTMPFRAEGRRFERVGNEETTGIRLHPERLKQPLRWRRPRMIFVCSLADLFHDEVPYEFVREVFNTIRRCSGYVVAATGRANPSHTFQVLTKRPERALEFWRTRRLGFETWPPNVWLGTSIENARYTWRADVLREIPAAVRFISAEPLLGSLMSEPGSSDTRRAGLDLTGIDWLIVGGESGGRFARPMHPEWARELRDACLERQWREAPIRERTAFFFKQWGSWTPGLVYTMAGESGPEVLFSDGQHMRYAGASPKSGGRLLDGREWNDMPTPAAVAA